MFWWPASNGTRERPAGHVERVGDPDDPGLDRERRALAAVADDRVQRLGDDHRPLGLVVDVGQQRSELVGGQEQAVALVVLAVDRHPDAVEQAAGRDHDLGVALAHPVVGDDARRRRRGGTAAAPAAGRC